MPIFGKLPIFGELGCQQHLMTLTDADVFETKSQAKLQWCSTRLGRQLHVMLRATAAPLGRNGAAGSNAGRLEAG